MSRENLESLLQDLQVRLAFQEDTLSQLDAAIIRQNELLDRMNLRLVAMEGRLSAMEARQSEAGPLADEKPPHY